MQKTVDIILEKTRVVRHPDDFEDFSTLGEYTDEMEPGYIFRGNRPVFVEDWPEDTERPDKGREWRCFIPPDNGEEIGTADYRKYALEDYERMEAFQRGEWTYITIYVSSVITANIGGDGDFLTNTICSSLSGIENDCDQMDIDGTIAELKAEQYASLKKIGFSEEEIEKSFSGCEWGLS